MSSKNWDQRKASAAHRPNVFKRRESVWVDQIRSESQREWEHKRWQTTEECRGLAGASLAISLCGENISQIFERRCYLWDSGSQVLNFWYRAIFDSLSFLIQKLQKAIKRWQSSIGLNEKLAIYPKCSQGRGRQRAEEDPWKGWSKDNQRPSSEMRRTII